MGTDIARLSNDISETRPLPRIHSSYSLTDDAVKDASLVITLFSWNVVLLPDSCCQYHALVREVSTSLTRLRRIPCRSMDCPDWQCLHCGMLNYVYANNEDANPCSFCDTYPEPHTYRRRIAKVYASL